MLNCCERRTPRRLAEALEPQAETALGKIVRRPFNRFDPDVTPWWLVPSNELPFYRHGKYFITWDGTPPNRQLFCSFYLEKGLAPELEVVYNSKKGKALLMSSDWRWPDFVQAAADGKLAAALQPSIAAGLRPEFRFTGSYVDDPGIFDPYNNKRASDEFVLRLAADGSTLEYVRARRDLMVLKPLNKVKKMADLAPALKEFDQDQFLWMTCQVGIGLAPLPAENLPEEAEWSAARIWSEFLGVFQPWIR